MQTQQIFTRNEVIRLIDKLMECGYEVINAITAENPDYDGEQLLELVESYHDDSEIDNSGIKLIAIERQEQIEKHGRTLESDARNNGGRELCKAAIALLQQNPSIMDFPESWRQSALTHKIAAKSYDKRVVIAGAMLAAESDRINFKIKFK